MLSMFVQHFLALIVSHFCLSLWIVCMFAQQLSLPPVCSALIVWMFIFIILSMSVSDMPNNSCPFLGTTKNLHFFLLLLCSTSTVHVLSYCSFVIYFNRIFLFLVADNYSLVILGNNFLYMCSGITLPLIPVATLYGTIISFGLLMFLSLLLVWSRFYWNELNSCSLSQWHFPQHSLGQLLLAPPHSWLWLSCFHTPLWSSQYCCILCMSSNMPGSVSGYGCYHCICTSVWWVSLYVWIF